MRRIVREVGVHLEHEVVVALERPAKAGEVRGAQSHLSRALEDVHARVRRHDRVDDRRRAVRRPVVDDQDLESRILAQHRLDQPGDVLALVVRRDDDERALDNGDRSVSRSGRRLRGGQFSG